ncbi:hypothetical protein RIF29_24942 [Crotalaria pallida]|uniref:Uncharacterized protein n=1 Tax=Crotalaria pallida TaxID=3830 RepID=A0AAN9ESV8_CROPI
MCLGERRTRTRTRRVEHKIRKCEKGSPSSSAAPLRKGNTVLRLLRCLSSSSSLCSTATPFVSRLREGGSYHASLTIEALISLCFSDHGQEGQEERRIHGGYEEKPVDAEDGSLLKKLLKMAHSPNLKTWSLTLHRGIAHIRVRGAFDKFLTMYTKYQSSEKVDQLSLSEITANLSNHALYGGADKGTVEHDIKTRYSGPSKDALAYLNKLREDNMFSDILVQISPPEIGHSFPKLKLRYKPSLSSLSSGTVAYLEVTHGVWKHVPMNVIDWPSPAAVLHSVESEIKAILTYVGVEVPNCYSGAAVCSCSHQYDPPLVSVTDY